MRSPFSPDNPRVQAGLRFYSRYRRFLPVVSFFAGFSWDSLTLTRIDRLMDNVLLLIYIILLATCILLLNLDNAGRILNKRILKYREWFPSAVQFLLGSLFSAYVIFYSQSASLSKTALFLVILVILMLATEILKKRLVNIYLQMGMFFLVSFSFFIFFLPVLTGIMNVLMFLAGGLLSLGLVLGMLRLLYRLSSINSREEYRRAIGVVCGIYLLMNFFYWMNWIPPVPLSARYGGMFHSVQKVDDEYILRFETPRWYQFLKDSDDLFHQAPGDTVFCYASIFAPAGLNTVINYHWQYYDVSRSGWVTTDRVGYTISGGREGGYRGYTYKQNIGAGIWRVDIETANQQLLKRIDFEIAPVEERNYELTFRKG